MWFEPIASIVNSKRKQAVVSALPTATVSCVVKLMNSENIGSVVIRSGEKPIGIFTERDVMVRVVGRGLDPDRTDVQTVMTMPVHVVDQHAPVNRAFQLMSCGRYRHLPVVQDGTLSAMLSMGYITKWIIERQQEQFDGAINAVKGLALSNRRPTRAGYRS